VVKAILGDLQRLTSGKKWLIHFEDFTVLITASAYFSEKYDVKLFISKF